MHGSLLASVLVMTFSITASIAAEPVGQFQDCGTCPKMTVLPAGEFLMGATSVELDRDLSFVFDEQDLFTRLGLIRTARERAARTMAFERPQHRVWIEKSFAIGITSVTTQEFAAFVHETGYHTGKCWMWHLGRPIPPGWDAWAKWTQDCWNPTYEGAPKIPAKVAA